MITTIGFDADDTLWQNEAYFRLTQERFADLLRDHAAPEHLMARLLEAERRNIGAYGFGVKGFTLSMIETAIEVTEGRVPASVIQEILGAGRAMLDHPVELLPGALEAVTALAQSHRIVLVTKGDLLHQERKLAQSGLGEHFHGVEIVSDKQADTYARVFARHGTGADQAAMVGNSLKSDVIPALEAGAFGIYVPHGVTWALEAADEPLGHARYGQISDLTGLAPLIARIGS
ncbi:HAD family hydrolase [Neotabrizicola sp. sgz301269]|uniref:HAD family hydrolase n=1 Tax=Neotabrizicola sp. sgz301269 TaxID=3276282 RepID=UPI00376FA293